MKPHVMKYSNDQSHKMESGLWRIKTLPIHHLGLAGSCNIEVGFGLVPPQFGGIGSVATTTTTAGNC